MIDFIRGWKSDYVKDRYDEKFYDIYVYGNYLFYLLKERYELIENKRTENDKTISKMLKFVEDRYKDEILSVSISGVTTG